MTPATIAARLKMTAIGINKSSELDILKISKRGFKRASANNTSGLFIAVKNGINAPRLKTSAKEVKTVRMSNNIN